VPGRKEGQGGSGGRGGERRRKDKKSCVNLKKCKKDSLVKQLIYPGMQHQVTEYEAILLT
jgi:hypothetical protein